ncbi:MAG: ParB N-terminal domain-containing protein [Actinobacteria bacterium]|nr:ParB N-terminal domain-containing protein [Actinomycetota bacterium]
MAKSRVATAVKELAPSDGFEMVSADELISHPDNANVMSAEFLEKLKGHIARSGRYPALIVRSLGNSQLHPDQQGKLQVLDGHHRLNVLKELSYRKVRVDNWGDLSDAQAKLLVATLNRLQGQDDPDKRAQLLGGLQQDLELSSSQLTELLPESQAELDKLLELNAPPAELAHPDDEQLALPWTVFATVEQIAVIEEAIAAAGESSPTAQQGDTPQGRALCFVAQEFLKTHSGP